MPGVGERIILRDCAPVNLVPEKPVQLQNHAAFRVLVVLVFIVGLAAVFGVLFVKPDLRHGLLVESNHLGVHLKGTCELEKETQAKQGLVEDGEHVVEVHGQQLVKGQRYRLQVQV